MPWPIGRSSVRSHVSLVALVALALALADRAGAHDRRATSGEGFQAMMRESVARMHSAMDLPFSGDVDRDFARMMIPHHRGAIDMAVAELRYGKDERLRRLAQQIIVDQQQEIALMHLALGDRISTEPPPTEAGPIHDAKER